jgi:DNA-binding NtrC family response regulator
MSSMLDLQNHSSETVPGQVILLVEDDADIGEFITTYIEAETPYHVLSITSAEEALKRLEEIKEARPMLFILDWWLPLMDAIELYDYLHSLEAFEHVPAVIITAAPVTPKTESAIAERGLELLPKPFAVEDLLHHIEQAIQGDLQPT